MCWENDGAEKLELLGPNPTDWDPGTPPFFNPSGSQTFLENYAILFVKVMFSGILIYEQIKAGLWQLKGLGDMEPWSPTPFCQRRSKRGNSSPRCLCEILGGLQNNLKINELDGL